MKKARRQKASRRPGKNVPHLAKKKSKSKTILSAPFSKSAQKSQILLMSKMVKRAHDGICVCHNTSKYPFVRFTYWNDLMTEITGYTMKEINRLGWYQTMYPDPEIQQKAINRMASMREGDDILSEEWTVTCKDGKKRVLLISTSILFREDNKTHVIAFMRDITTQKKVEQALRESEEKYRTLFQSAPGSIAIVGLDGTILETNSFYGIPREKIIGKKFDQLEEILHPQDIKLLREHFYQILKGGEAQSVEIRVFPFPGHQRWIEFHAAFLKKNGKPYAIQIIALDITERKNLEAQLLQAQKMEIIGRLAGGIAHDFNNQLLVMMMAEEMLERIIPPDDPRYMMYINMIKQASEHSSALIKKILAFSRQQIIEPKIINLNELFLDLVKMLERLIGEDIELEINLEPNLGLVNVDPGQIEQILINLAINARDAMPRGGKLTIETVNILPSDKFLKGHSIFLTTPCVMFSVKDNGIGMDENTLSQIYEPFFTTKEPGKGTGLGLTIVYSAVKEARGEIIVESTPGKGTIFRIYLPRVEEKDLKQEKQSEISVQIDTGRETIWVVEDNDKARDSIIKVLSNSGYKVFESNSGEDAFNKLKDLKEPIDLLITDITMKGMSGKELADKVIKVYPNLKVLYISGYMDSSIANEMIRAREYFLAKPFTGKSLCKKVREILNHSVGEA